MTDTVVAHRATPWQPVDREASLRQCISVIAIFMGAVLIFGIWAAWPYLCEEHRRLEPWKIVGVWIGNVAALGWFARFAFRHLVSKKPLISDGARDSEGRGWWWLLTVSGLLAVATDLAFTLYLIQAEETAYARARIVTGHAYDVRRQTAEIRTVYRIRARFTDAVGRSQQCFLRAYDERDGGFPDTFPGEVAEALRAERTSFPIPLRYDSSWPSRSWIDGAGSSFDGNDLSSFSLATQIFAGLILLLFFAVLGLLSRLGRLPWWGQLYRAIPLCVEATIMAGIGLGTRLMA